ncbi:long-chain fatty acid--CoA ligase [Sorangium cellulosum]|uniref:Long-chain fatty acid--CoA ligase n=1 Tax=Sorangium cellulosum TaxID=56 RepID=A0A2L0FAS2_SORCE|nr:long-chain fatty acid--CoA ligase [Sorangium cellulosum]AUX48621.1 long-chain fatty acid--CoA ligase [Sorangium cellulosum]
MPCDSIPRRLLGQARVRPEAPAHYVKEGGFWRMTSFREYAGEVRRAGKALLALGVEPGEALGLLGFNRPEWVVLHVAGMAIGAAPAGIYTTCSPEEVRHVLHHAAAKVVLVENRRQLEKVLGQWDRLPQLEWVVQMRGAEPAGDPRVLTWDELLARGSRVPDELFEQRLDALEPGGLATLIYTSGTVGPPKGVMLSHENLTWTADVSARIIPLSAWDVHLSYLPLSHIAEQMFTIHLPAAAGAAVYFAESIEAVAGNLREVQPTIFFGVPRIWEKLKAGVEAKLSEAKGVGRFTLDQARRVGLQCSELRARGERPGPLLALQHRLFDKLVYSKVKAAVGFARAHAMSCGAAPIAKEVLEFFASLDLLITEVYGQSEVTGPTSYNVQGRTKLGSVGPVVPGVDVRIADDGELLVKGPNVFLGYYKDPEATEQALADGWLRSGDLGRLDEEGFLHITGRKKELLITAGGKNVSPTNIEEALKRHDLIAEAVVLGDGRRFLSALIVLDPDAVERFAASRGLGGDVPREAPEIREAVQRAVDEVNSRLAQVETIKKFSILPRGLTLEDGELTPTLKIKRRNVSQNFAREIEAMYAE